MLKKLYIIGASGYGREVLDIVLAINNISPTYEILGFIDEDETKFGQVINDVTVLGNIDYIKNNSKNNERPLAVIAIANTAAKAKIAITLENYVTWESIIHPTADISRYSTIGKGFIAEAFTYVGPNVSVGNHCALNFSSVIGHDSIIGDYVSIMDNCEVTGNCKLSNCVFVAISASLIPGIHIGENATIGAGAVVIRDVDADTTVVGNPAKDIRSK